MSAIAIVEIAPQIHTEPQYQNGLPDGWLSDPLDALEREHGPFTAVTAEQILDEEAVERYNG